MAKTATLVIPNVHLNTLEQQRLALGNISQEATLGVSQTELDAINGIQNMLDHWSDERNAGNLLQMGDIVNCKDEADRHWWDRTYIFICELPTGACCVTHQEDWEDSTVDWELIHVQCCEKQELYVETVLSETQIQCLRDNSMWEE